MKTYDLIIKNGVLYKGDGKAPVAGDLAVSGDKITTISPGIAAHGKTIIDAGGLAVSPGFIDIHSHTHAELLVNRNAESKIRQGITTEISGNCGMSPYPLSKKNDTEYHARSEALFGLKSAWKTLGQFFELLENPGISINYGTFTGHGDLRNAIMGRKDRAPAYFEMEAMKRALKQTLTEGSLGLSTGLEYAPGSYAETEELIELCKTAVAHSGRYASHIRDEGEYLEEAVGEVIRICHEANIPVQISHLKACNTPNWYKADMVIARIDELIEQGYPIGVDRYPYTAYGTTLEIFLPLWSREGGTEKILQRLKDPESCKRIKEYTDMKISHMGGADRVLVSYVRHDKNRHWEGYSVQKGSEETGLDPFGFIKKLLIEDENGVEIAGFAMSEENTEKILARPWVSIGSDSVTWAPYGALNVGNPHPRDYGSFPRVLGYYCRERGLFPMEEAIRKMTSLPAQQSGLKNRGLLKAGYYADIVLFDQDTIVDTATFVKPKQYPEGINTVIVNGQIILQNNKHTEVRSGKILRNGG
jgi:N-acyl-D-amino-acid deacylase